MKANKLTVGAITLGVIIILNLLFGYSTFAYEVLYRQSLFQIIRVSHDFTLGYLPIPSLYLIVPTFFWFFFRNNCLSVRSFLTALIAALLWIINLFYLLWGFNYQQPSLYTELDLDRPMLDSTYIKQAFLDQTLVLDSLASDYMMVPGHSQLETEIRKAQETLLKEWGTPTWGRVKVRKLISGSLLRFRTSGIYIPHAFEGHLDKGLYVKQHPFTLAHEMAHGYGYTDESVCNFIGYLTCLKTGNPYIRYSAELAYWRYLSRYYAYYYADEWTSRYDNLPAIVRKDLDQIRKHNSRYKDLMPVMRDVIYDNYLKSHGVKAGLKSYDQMIELIAAYRGWQQ